MYPISAAAKALFEAEQRQILRITGTDKNGTSINITDADIMADSFSIDRYCCNGSKIEIGTAIASELSMKLNNTDGRFNDIVFEGTELYVEIGIADWSLDDPTIYWMPCGYYTPDQQPRRMDIITISAMDRMQLFDRLVTELSIVEWTDNNGNVMTDDGGNELEFNTFVAFPSQVKDIVKNVCELCGVELYNGDTSLSYMPNGTYVIPTAPNIQTQTTYRNLIQWCVGIMGACAFIDWRGKLYIARYNLASGYESTTSNRYSSDYQENSLTITGVQFTNAQNVVIVSGSADYALDLKGNLLAAPYIADILPALRDYWVGYTYRPFSASAVNAPYLWPLDKVKFTDKDGNEYQSVLTNVNFGINCTTWLQSVGETEQTNKGIAPTTLTPEQAQLITEAINSTAELDASLDQESIFNRLTNNGEAQGIYMQDGKLYINLTYARAGTLVLGGLNNLNGVLQVRDADDNLIGYWNNTGASMTGTFVTEYTDEDNYTYKTEMSNGIIKFYINGQRVGEIAANETLNLSLAANEVRMDAGNYYVRVDNYGDMEISANRIVVSGNSSLPAYGASGSFVYAKPNGDYGTIEITKGIVTGIS